MRVYYADERLRVRSMLPRDARAIYETYYSYGWEPSMETYEGYLREQEAGARRVFIAEYDGKTAGICTLLLEAREGPWAGKGVPEIEDLCVFFHLHGRGIGTRLLDAAEAEAAKTADQVCLAVGVHSGYGPAQRMYVRRGYVPDGSGVWYRGKVLEQYAPCRNDDDLLLYMAKRLK